MESRHIAQNNLLQAYAKGLVGVVFGAFEDEKVANLLPVPPTRQHLSIIPIGYWD
ncbi:MAG: nitroreductase family protein [Anaerolineales bacterium]|nr:nitroreductase family protein [Anaerolineales bacterium]